MSLAHYNFGAMTGAQKAVGKAFLKNSTFAVVGTSKDQTKVGNRILRWYQAKGLDVIPVHPVCLFTVSYSGASLTHGVIQKELELEGLKTITDISELSSPSTTALSIITPPKITLSVLAQAKELNVPSYWIQPGAEDEAVLEYIKENAIMLSSTLPICDKQERFFASSQFAVIGASSDSSRLASKVLGWYRDRHMDVIPVHPRERRLDGLSAIPSISKLPSPSTTALTISATPLITLSLLKQAHKLSIPTIWIQPGASDQHVVDYIEANNLSEKVIWGGPCILHEGEHVIQRRWFDETYSS
ncbi:hypothetical protein C0995_003176 [Termitomyces sp. Mi166|nr:hypothetical protein C0995_003176 [Termitomyces sp. Mi166\